eukprot:TRINITY_DN5223_c0_g1_i1.p1 TRINITY_DN5223_c0_g1~~TRINITY_DN5223_c0_g1_i1.p1  ORF type:complete len:759 (+),score=140.48 TRINITY_DN5223_c0_g1_i1:230-2278(+)
MDTICAGQNAQVSLAIALAFFALPEPRQHDLTFSFRDLSSTSSHILREWLPKVGPGLHSLSGEIDDEFLQLLSLSPSARTIKALYLSLSRITDASAAVWYRFSALEDVNIWLCNDVGIETLRSVSLIPSLRLFQASIDEKFTIEHLEELLGQDRLPNLEQVSLRPQGPGSTLYEDAEAKKRLIDLLSKRPNLSKLTLDLGAEFPVDDLITLHKFMPHLTYLVGTPVDMADILKLLPFCGNLRWFSLSQPISKEQFTNLASCVPLLETLLIDLDEEDGSNSLGNDLSVFSSLKHLQLSCTNVHKINKLPLSLIDLEMIEAGGSEEQEIVPSSEIKLFMDEICRLTNLKDLRIECHAPLVTPPTFNVLTSRLTRLEELSIVQRDSAALTKTFVPLNTLPHLRQFWVNVPNLYPDPLHIYLPALRSTEYTCRIPWSSTREQLPNLSYVNVSDMSAVEKEDINATFFERFGSQLTGIVAPPADLPISKLCTFSNLTMLTFAFEISISCSDASAVLQSLPKLISFSAALGVNSPDFKWLKHSNLRCLVLHLEAETVEPQLAVTSDTTPFLSSFYINFKICKHANLRIANLKYLDGVTVQARSELGAGTQIDLELSDAPFLSSAAFFSLEFESLKIFNAPFLKKIEISNISIPEDASPVRVAAPCLNFMSWDEDMEHVCSKLNSLNTK